MRRRRDVPRRAAAAALVAGLALGGCGSPAQPPPDPQECPPDPAWTTLLDGSPSSVEEWEHAGPGGFERLDDGTLLSTGGLGLLWHPSALTPPYLAEVQWSVAGDHNSGVFVGFPDPGEDPMAAVEAGYEVQIDASDTPERTTGGLYGVQGPDLDARDDALEPPGEWNEFEIEVRDDRIAVRLNGSQVVDHAVGPARPVADPGHLGLQNHGDGDDVRFRSVRVRPLATTDVPGCSSS